MVVSLFKPGACGSPSISVRAVEPLLPVIAGLLWVSCMAVGGGNVDKQKQSLETAVPKVVFSNSAQSP